MRQYICSILRDAEKCINRYLSFMEECKDSTFFPDIPFWISAVRANQRICSIYFEHWPSEFDPKLLKRFRRIIGFDWRVAYQRYFGCSCCFTDLD